MVEGYNFMAGSQADINRRLLRKIEALEEANGSTDLQDRVEELEAKVAALESASDNATDKNF